MAERPDLTPDLTSDSHGPISHSTRQVGRGSGRPDGDEKDWWQSERRAERRAESWAAAESMERAGWLTPQAARAIAYFCAQGQASASWSDHSKEGWITFRGQTYTPTAFSRRWRADVLARLPATAPDRRRLPTE
jgi:hypothetical protein